MSNWPVSAFANAVIYDTVYKICSGFGQTIMVMLINYMGRNMPNVVILQVLAGPGSVTVAKHLHIT